MTDKIGKISALDCADAYFLTSDINVSYATGFSGDSSQVLITKGRVWFFTDSRYTLQAEKDIDGAEIITTTAQMRIPAICDVLKKNNVSVLAVEKDFMTLNEFAGYDEKFAVRSYVDISDKVLRMRAIKGDGEIKKIMAAAKGNENVLEALRKTIKPGMTEFDVRAELVYQINIQGMECAFTPIVAAGKNSAIPHATVSDNIIKYGDMLTLDFGCRYEGYCSDVTRTFGIGDVDERLKKIYYIVKVAQQNALEAAKEEKRASKIDAAARDFITDNGYGEYYNHGTGHGVGLAIHELPVLNAASGDIIEDNMVYTIEPGIYVPGLGGVRIEDMCVGGKGNLYSFSKELVLIQ